MIGFLMKYIRNVKQYLYALIIFSSEMNALKRTKISNMLNSKEEPKRFNRQKEQLPIQQFYSQGVQNIINHRRLMEIKDDTVLMSIDIFKNYLLNQGAVAKATVIPICISCLMISCKINEVYPPKITDFTEIFDYIEEKGQLIKIEALVLKQCDYLVPFQQNISFLLEQQLNAKMEETHKKMEEGLKIIYKCIGDSFYLSVENQTFSKALFIILTEGDEEENRKIGNKAVAAVVHNIRQKMKTPCLKIRDMNRA